jgi:hypothetical protein
VGGQARIERDNDTIKVSVSIYNGSSAYIFVKVHLRYKANMSEVLNYITSNPLVYREIEDNIPQEIIKDYVKTPHELVENVVKPDFESWLRSKGYVASNVSKAFIAASASVFIYGYYIKYNASAMPRTLEDVILNKTGDCDDMTRVLMNLLWSYGIPARMEYGYVFMNLDNYVMPIGKSYMIFNDAGPHGWLTVYLNPIGWLSLDLLAGARLTNPAIITGFTGIGNVSRESIEKAEEFYNQVRYAEYVTLVDEEEAVQEGLPFNLIKTLNDTAYQAMIPYIVEIAEKSGIEAPIKYFTTETPITVTEERTVILTYTNTESVYVNTTLTVTETLILGPQSSENLILTAVAIGLIIASILIVTLMGRKRRLRV